MTKPRAVPSGFEPYIWARQVDEVAASHGLAPAQVLRFDANVPPLPGVPGIPLGESFAALNEYPKGTYRELREAAAAYAGVSTEELVIGAGADDLIGLVARTFLAPGRRAAVQRPTYPLYAIASGIEGAEAAVVPLEVEAVARRVGGDVARLRLGDRGGQLVRHRGHRSTSQWRAWTARMLSIAAAAWPGGSGRNERGSSTTSSRPSTPPTVPSRHAAEYVRA